MHPIIILNIDEGQKNEFVKKIRNKINYSDRR